MNPIDNPIIVFGILSSIIALIHYLSGLDFSFLNRFFRFFPPLLLCYIIPAFLTNLNLISDKEKILSDISYEFILPASLVLMTLSIDLKSLISLGWKPLFMFSVGSIGIIIGGPIALFLTSLFYPEILEPIGNEETWKGLATISGSWIGGGANQVAMLKLFEYSEEKYGIMALVDIIVANIWLAVLLIGVGKRKKIDKWLKADDYSIEKMKQKTELLTKNLEKNPTTKDFILLFGVVFGSVSIGHFFSEQISDYIKELSFVKDPRSVFYSLKSSFFWLITIVTLLGIIFSKTPIRNYEGIGASKFGTFFIYIVVASIGMKIQLKNIDQYYYLLILGFIWIFIHSFLLLIIARIIKAPFFYVAVGSQANIGGAASAPLIAQAFHPSLSTVGVLMAVIGYVVGTYGSIICANLMAWIYISF